MVTDKDLADLAQGRLPTSFEQELLAENAALRQRAELAAAHVAQLQASLRQTLDVLDVRDRRIEQLEAALRELRETFNVPSLFHIPRWCEEMQLKLDTLLNPPQREENR